MTNPESPHKAVISCTMHIHELDKDGHCSTSLANPEEYNLISDFLVSVDGDTLEDCIANIKQLVEEYKKWTKKS